MAKGVHEKLPRPPLPTIPAAASWAGSRWSGAALVFAVLLAYANSLQAPFLFDDAGAVQRNATIRDLTSLAVLNPPADGSTTTGRPLVNLSYALNYAFGGENVVGYRAVNIAIHALAALTLLGLLRRTFSARPVVVPPAHGSVVALVAAALWALHPLQTESVVGIAQRTELICGLFYLLTLYTFARAVLPAEDRSRGPHIQKWYWIGSIHKISFDPPLLQCCSQALFFLFRLYSRKKN
jgi:hypothetical protein